MRNWRYKVHHAWLTLMYYGAVPFRLIEYRLWLWCHYEQRAGKNPHPNYQPWKESWYSARNPE